MAEDEDIRKFVDSLETDKDVTPEDFHKALKGAYQDRSRQIYFIWKKLKELYPEVDANRVIREGSWEFGLFQGKQIAERKGTYDIGPVDALLGQTSKGGWSVFEQKITELNDERAVKLFHACPHAEALKNLGLSKDEVKMFCRDMLGACDYAICSPFPHIKIEFPTTVADGNGEPCRMIITRIE